MAKWFLYYVSDLPFCTLVGLPWEIISFSTCEVARQRRNLVGTYIRLLEVTVKSRARISLTVKKPTAFLFFC